MIQHHRWIHRPSAHSDTIENTLRKCVEGQVIDLPPDCQRIQAYDFSVIMTGTAVAREPGGTSQDAVQVETEFQLLLRFLQTNLCPASASIADLVKDAAQAASVRDQEEGHAFKMDRIAKTLAKLQDNVWVPAQLQRIVACCAFLHAHKLLEYTPRGAGVNDLAMAVRERAQHLHCCQLDIIPLAPCY